MVPVGDDDGLVGAEVEPVEADRGHIGDHGVAVRHDREDVAVGDGRVAGVGLACAASSTKAQDRVVCVADGGVGLVVTFGWAVDQSYVGDGQDRADDASAADVDAGVVVVVGVALPVGA